MKGWFGTKKQDAAATPSEAEKLRAEISSLREVVEKARRSTDIEVELEGKKKELLEKELEISRLEEAHKKRMREIEHKVGLQQKAAEQDRAAAVKEAELAVREANLDTEKEQFKQQMEFTKEEMNKRAEAQESLLHSILQRLPNHTVHQFVGDAPDQGKVQAAAALEAGGKQD